MLQNRLAQQQYVVGRQRVGRRSSPQTIPSSLGSWAVLSTRVCWCWDEVRQGLAAEVSTLVWLPRAGCALLWTASGCELLCFSSFAFHFELQTAECLCHFIFVSVCVVTNHTRNHDRIAYMWQKKDLSDFGCFHFLFKINFFCSDVGVWRKQGKCEVWSVKEAVGSEKCEVWSVKFKFGVRSAQCEVWGLECEGSSGKCEVWSVKCGVWSFKFGVRRVQCEVWSVKTLLRLSLKKSNGCRGLEGEARSVKCEVWSVKEAVGSVKCEVRSVKCEVWSVKFQVRSAKSAVWSVECEDFASSLAEKNQTVVEGRTRSGQGAFEL